MPIHCKIRSKEPDLLLYINCKGSLIEQDITHFQDFFKKKLEQPQMLKMFVDMRQVDSAKLQCIKKLAKFMNNYQEKAIDKVIATAILIDKPIIENLVKILFNIKKPSTPTKVTSDINEACEFLN